MLFQGQYSTMVLASTVVGSTIIKSRMVQFVRTTDVSSHLQYYSSTVFVYHLRRMHIKMHIWLMFSWVVVQASALVSRRNMRAQQKCSQIECICINCSWVERCSSYHFVESKHEQPHLTSNPDFTPRQGSPSIRVQVRREDEPGFRRNWSDGVEPAPFSALLVAMASSIATLNAPTSSVESQEPEEEMADIRIPLYSTEYDVVKCADYLEDKGRWIRLMPEKIRKVNPNFVPT